MIVFEKARAICQQTQEYKKIININIRGRARDFYDIYLLMNYYNIKISKKNINLLKKIFEAKKVPFFILKKVKKYKDLHEKDYESLKATLLNNTNIKDFNSYFNFFLDKFSNIHF